MNTKQGTTIRRVPETYKETAQWLDQSCAQQRSSSPAVPKKDYMKNKKRVHWDAGVIDNQGKTAYDIKKPKGAIIILPYTEEPTTSTQQSHDINVVSCSPTKNHHRPRKMRDGSKVTEIKVSSRRSSTTVTCEKTQRSSPTCRPARSQKAVKYVFPAVPDPPGREDPPPAPRPARLPTPDLPEAHRGMFGELPPLGAAAQRAVLLNSHLIEDYCWQNDAETKITNKMAAQSKRLVIDVCIYADHDSDCCKCIYQETARGKIKDKKS
jgi:hypothetical protein